MVANDFAGAPIRIIFKDEDDGFSYFSDDFSEISFKFYEKRNSMCRVQFYDTEQETVKVIEISDNEVIVRFA